MSWPSKTIRPAVGSYEPEDRAPERRLAATRLADEAERLAALDRQRDVVDGLDVADVAVEHDAALDREVDLEVRRARRAARRPTRSRRRRPRRAPTRRRAPG